MNYKHGEIPKCPHCNVELDTYVCGNTPLGVQNLAVNRLDAVADDTCYECDEWHRVTTIEVHKLYKVEPL